MSVRTLIRLAAVLIVLALIPAGSAQARQRAIVAFAPATSHAQRVDAVRDAGGRVVRDLHLIHALGVALPRGGARALERAPGVRQVTPDAVVRPAAVQTDPSACGGRRGVWCPGLLSTAYIQSTRTDKAWLDPTTPTTGAGVTVAVVDTGIAGDLPDFRGADGSSRVIASVVTDPDATTATDDYGHGTHVAGLLAGNGRQRAASDPQYGRYVGAAPDAKLVSIKASDDHGNATLIDIIDGLQFAVDHRADYGIRVVNLSVGSTDANPYLVDPLDAAVEAAWFSGIVVVTAAGNRGTAPDAVSYAPANDPYAIAVGAVDDRGTKATDDDVLTSWSSRGRTQGGTLKPDIVAPGMSMVAPLAPGSDFASLCPDCIVDGGYFRVSGTSMAAPVVSGIAADLISAHPTWTPDMVKTAIVRAVRVTADGAREVAADLALHARTAAPGVNANLTPSTLLDPTSRQIDYTRASWSRASFSLATGPLAAAWSRASWKCDICADGDTAVDPTRASWRRASWRRASWKSFLGQTPDEYGELAGGDTGSTADTTTDPTADSTTAPTTDGTTAPTTDGTTAPPTTP